jgi:hypothetical protein
VRASNVSGLDSEAEFRILHQHADWSVRSALARIGRMARLMLSQKGVPAKVFALDAISKEKS